MTQIMSCLRINRNKTDRPNQLPFKEVLLKVLKRKTMIISEVESQVYTLFSPSHFHPCVLDNIQALITFRFESNVIFFNLKPLNEDGIEIRALSQYQRTASIKYCNIINSEEDEISIRVNPLTGEINVCTAFHINFSILFDAQQLIFYLCESLISCQNILKKLLDQLEVTPFAENFLLSKIAHQVDLNRIYVCDAVLQQVESSEERNHNIFFFNSPILKVDFSNQATDSKQERRQFVERIKNNMKWNPRKVKKSNWAPLIIHPDPRLIELKKQILLNANRVIDYQYKSFSGEFVCSGTSLCLEFIYRPLKQVKMEYQISEQVSKKKYYSFIHEYAFIKQYAVISSKYLIRKKMSPYVTLQNYVGKNSLSMSLTTRLEFCCSLLSIGSICKQELKINPSFGLRGINICEFHQLKLNSLIETEETLQMKLAQSCYQLLFNRAFSARRLKSNRLGESKWLKIVRQVDNGEAKFSGPSPIVVFLKRMLLQNLRANGFSQQARSVSIQSMLLIFAVSLKQLDNIFQKTFNHEMP